MSITIIVERQDYRAGKEWTLSDETPRFTKAGKPWVGRGRKPRAPETVRSGFVALRVTEEYANWVREVAEHTGLDVSNLYDLALTQYARAIRFHKPPPPR